jgi:GNAT superfamily N-acetyltransferase
MKIDFVKNNMEYIDSIADFMFHEWGHHRKGTTVERYYNYLSDKDNTDKIPLTLIAKSEGNELLGFASLVISDMEINKNLSPWISGVFVLPEHRGKGYGKLLINSIEQLASDFGYDKLFLFTFDKENFYTDLSWKIIKNDFYLNSNVTVMIKDLKT